MVFNPAASEYLDGSNVRVFLRSGVVALSMQGLGEGFHLTREKDRRRVILSSCELIAYLKERYGYGPGRRYPVWAGQDGTVFFSGVLPEASCTALDDTFEEIRCDYSLRAGSWAYVDNNRITFSKEARDRLGDQLTAYQCGPCVMLHTEADGPISMTYIEGRHGQRMIRSYALASYLRRRYDGLGRVFRLRACLGPDSVYLAEEEQDFRRSFHLPPVRLELNDAEKRTLKLSSGNRILLSADAAAALGPAVTVLRSGGIWALAAAPGAPLAIKISGPTAYLFCREFSIRLQEDYAGAERFYLLEHGDLWVLSTTPAPDEEIPAADTFQPEDIAQRRRDLPRAWSDGRSLGLSHHAMLALGISGRAPVAVAAYQHGDALYLKTQGDGQLTVTPNPVKAGGLIRSTRLVEWLRAEIGNDKIIPVQAFAGGLLLASKAVPVPKVKTLSRAVRIDNELTADHCDPGRATVVLRTDVIEFSARTAACMGERVSLYSSNQALAFQDDELGCLRPLHARSRKYISSRKLTRFIKCFFNCGERKDLCVYAEPGRVVISEMPLAGEQAHLLRWNKVPDEWFGFAGEDRMLLRDHEDTRQLM